MQIATASLLAATSIVACVSPPTAAETTYNQLAMLVDVDARGNLRLVVGGAEDMGGDRVRIDGTVMGSTPCAWKPIRSTIASAKDVSMVELLDNGRMKGPNALSRDFSAALDHTIAARDLRPADAEIACAKRLLDEMAFNEDSN